jgi:hypothetical protein
MAALISKPGITNASCLSIPKTWDGTWFRSFVNSQLTGADVRNAIGANGIVVSGTIASPYATISLGGTGPIVLTNNVTINPASGIPLTVKINGTTVFEVTGSLTGPTIEAYGPTAGALVDMTPDTGSFTGTFTGFTTTVTGTCVWARIGNLVMLIIPAVSGTSNATSMSMTGLPAEISSSVTQWNPTNVTNNGAAVAGICTISSSSIAFAVGAGGTAFTASGTKGITDAITYAYTLF